MSAQGPDPDPRTTPGLEPGGGVSPGDMPPDSSQTFATTHREPRQTRKMAVTWVIIVIATVVLVVGFFLAYLIVYLVNA